MLLKSLVMQGFKTFPDKTVLHFERGITAVVGPNGSGKSNISDAIRWVLGEQSARTLRCSKMEDVIFGGSPARKPLGYAEVTLTIDNTGRELPFDADTVAVSRRYYRSGESEYLINKASVRLRDIHELFMDTGLGRDGYSMVGQGKIDSIVAARSEERREIFDEAAGISRYRYRKEESERRLEKAEENLLRLRDIVSELEGRIEPLRIQSEKAQQFLEYSEEKRTLEIGLWLETLNRSGTVLREQADKISVAQGQYDEIGEVLAAFEEEMEACYQKMNACSSRIDELHAEAAKQEALAAQRDGEASVVENDLHHNAESVERIKGELAQSYASETDMDAELAQKETAEQEKRALAAQKNKEYVAYTEKLETLRRGMDESSGKADAVALRIASITASLSEARIAVGSAESSLEEIRRRLSDIDAAKRTWNERREDAEKALDYYQAQIETAQTQIAAASNAIKGHEMRLQSRKTRAEEAKKRSDRAELDAREQERRAKLLEDLEKNMEGFQQSVKTVMREASHGALRGICGPVSRILTVPSEYAAAIETALGAAMQNIVVHTEEDAKRAIALLKGRNAGRATFLPLSVIRGKTLEENGLADCPGFVGMANALCSCEERYREVRDSLLGRIAVAEDLDSAVAIARRFRYRFRIVTLDGQVVNAGGSMTGGSMQKNAGLLSRTAEIERIKEKAAMLREQAKQALDDLHAAGQEVASEEAALSAAKGTFYAAQDEKFKLETERKRVEAERVSAEESLKSLQTESEAADVRTQALLRGKTEAETTISALQEELASAQAEVDAMNVGREDLARRCTELSEHLQEIRMAALEAEKDAASFQAAAEELRRRKADSEGRRRAQEAQIAELEARSEQLRMQAQSLRESAQSLRESAQSLRAEAETAGQERVVLETAASNMRAEEREKTNQRETVGHELARLEERRVNLQNEYDSIITKLWEEYELTRREAEAVAKPVEQVSAAKKRLAELKSKIKGLGSVNLAAVEEYKEVSERYAFMTDQISDVEKSRDELRRLIHSLMGKMRDIFLERFEKINGNFTEIFKELFGGGTASLSLSDPEDVLNSGINIAVQPPGKIVTNLELLSGGEKALVAISIYFAIMKVNPPPFCLLDEIEAALDEVNVTRFANYLRRMNQNTQCIAITHRRGTMEEADVLYGVTMQNEGMSKLLELHPYEVESALGIKET